MKSAWLFMVARLDDSSARCGAPAVCAQAGDALSPPVLGPEVRQHCQCPSVPSKVQALGHSEFLKQIVMLCLLSTPLPVCQRELFRSHMVDGRRSALMFHSGFAPRREPMAPGAQRAQPGAIFEARPPPPLSPSLTTFQASRGQWWRRIGCPGTSCRPRDQRRCTLGRLRRRCWLRGASRSSRHRQRSTGYPSRSCSIWADRRWDHSDSFRRT
jgi:hypothetical protein